MKHSTTIVPLKNRENSHSPRVQVKAFNANTDRWQREFSSWLREMQAEGRGYIEAHTLHILGTIRIASFNIFVCERLQGSLPVRVLESWEVGGRFKHLVIADCEKLPPSVTVVEHFWSGPSEGESHFELVRPLIDDLVSSFCVEESPWAG